MLGKINSSCSITPFFFVINSQLIKDMVSVSEATNWSVRGSSQSKYRALRCQVDHVSEGTPEFQRIYDKVSASQNESVKMLQITKLL